MQIKEEISVIGWDQWLLSVLSVNLYETESEKLKQMYVMLLNARFYTEMYVY